MKVIATRPLNLHSASTDGGLVHVPAKLAVIVPDDVVDHPQHKILTKSGTLTVLKGKTLPTDSYETLAARAKLEKEKEADEEGNVKKPDAQPPSLIPAAKPADDEVEDDEDEDDEDEETDKK